MAAPKLVDLELYPNGPTARGNVINNLPFGTWVLYYPNSKVKWQQGSFDSKGNKSGKWSFYTRSGNLEANILYSSGRVSKVTWHNKSSGELGWLISADIHFVPGLADFG